MSIPQSFLQELLARTDVVEVVGRYVQLKKSGANFMGLCPFHGEKSPSFSVSPAKQFYHCFGCGANGNAISFLIEHGGLTFIEAVQDLAQQAGLTIPDDQAAPRDREQAQRQREHQSALTDLLASAAKAYARQLKTSPRAVAYLKGRGLTGEIARQYGLGYAPEGWRPLASLLSDYADARLVECGLVIAPDDTPLDTPDHMAEASTRSGGKRYDRFRDRIMFPIRNVKGDTIGFGGRVLDKGEPKYLNSPETPVFSKGRELYGLFEARSAIREKQYALVTEGYMDVVALAQLGFGNAVATLGTACTPDHIQKLLRFTDNVVFSFDGDAAGRRAAAKAMHAALPHATDTRSIRFLFLPPEHDPDSFIREQGPQAFEQCVQQAVPLSRFLSDTAKTGCDLATPEGRAHMASNARALWQALPECAYKRQILADLAQQIGLSTNELLDVWQLQPTTPQSSDFHSNKSNKNQRRTPENLSKSGDDAFEPVYDDPEPHWQDWGERPLPRSTPDGSRLYNTRRGDSTDGQGWRRTGKFGYRGRGQPPMPREPLPQLQSRAKLVARILLTYPQAWDWLTPDDHHLLAEQPEPIGPLLTWMESQWHEHGPQPWAVLQQAMAHEPFAHLAQTLMSQALTLGSMDDALQEPTDLMDDTRRELQELTLRMQVDHLTTLEKLALADASRHPQALERYRHLHERRKALLALLNKPPKL